MDMLNETFLKDKGIERMLNSLNKKQLATLAFGMGLFYASLSMGTPAGMAADGMYSQSGYNQQGSGTYTSQPSSGSGMNTSVDASVDANVQSDETMTGASADMNTDAEMGANSNYNEKPMQPGSKPSLWQRIFGRSSAQGYSQRPDASSGTMNSGSSMYGSNSTSSYGSAQGNYGGSMNSDMNTDMNSGMNSGMSSDSTYTAAYGTNGTSSMGMGHQGHDHSMMDYENHFAAISQEWKTAIALTPDQQKKLDTLEKEYKMETDTMQMDIMKMKKDMMNYLTMKDAKQDQVKVKIDEISDAKRDLMKKRVDFYFEVESFLTDSQKTKSREFWASHMASQKGKMGMSQPGMSTSAPTGGSSKTSTMAKPSTSSNAAPALRMHNEELPVNQAFVN
jgi:hypothetical protein